MINAKRFADTQQAAEGCAAHIISVLAEAMSGGSDATLAISGGTSPKLMFEVFAKTTFPWERVQLFWVDERGVPPADAQSNFKLADDAWLAPGQFPRANVHRMQGELPAQTAAQRYSAALMKFFKLAPGEMPRFDVIHRGMGPDAHTASLFPGEPLIEDRSGLAAAVWVEKFKQWRITLLPGVLEAARHTAMLVTGADKAQALAAVLAAPYNPIEYPAQIATRKQDPAVWFVDAAAAAGAENA